MIFVFHMVDNIVGKGGNAVYQHFLLFPHNVFKGLFSQGCWKSGLCGRELNTNTTRDIIKHFYKFNLFPNIPFWDRPKLKDVADNNLNLATKGF